MVAQKVQIFLVDDIDGGDAEETVTFGLDGLLYEIDLNKENAARLREVITPFIQAGRKAPAKHSKPERKRDSHSDKRDHSRKIRAWAKTAGKPVNERGRIPAAIVAEYEATQRA